MARLIAIALALTVGFSLLFAGCKPKESAGSAPDGDTSGKKGAEMMKEKMKEAGKTKRPGD